jgi:hypothetical protein
MYSLSKGAKGKKRFFPNEPRSENPRDDRQKHSVSQRRATAKVSGHSPGLSRLFGSVVYAVVERESGGLLVFAGHLVPGVFYVVG